MNGSLRKLVDALIPKVPEGLSTDGELVLGGDIRLSGNLWLRDAFKEAGLLKVPREGQIRLVVLKIMKKKELGTLV